MPATSALPPRAHGAADGRVTLQDACMWQADRCAASGSPVAARLLRACADTAAEWAPPAGLDVTAVRFGDHIPLRVMAALHYLALTRRAPGLALHLPTLGGHADPESPHFAAGILTALIANPGIVQDYIARAPQTNEPGRQAPLRRALECASAGHPVDLVELACSAGLNLGVDVSACPGVVIASRRGCDLHPVDATTTHGRALLSSYIWVDDTERFARLGAAIAAVGQHRPAIEQADAASFVIALQPRPHHTTLVWQSALEPYLDAVQSEALQIAMDALARRLPADATLIYATWEDAGDTSDPATAFALRVHTWPASLSAAHPGTNPDSAIRVGGTPATQSATGVTPPGKPLAQPAPDVDDAATAPDRPAHLAPPVVLARGSAHGVLAAASQV